MYLIQDIIASIEMLGREYNKMSRTTELITKLKELQAEIDSILEDGIEGFLEDYKNVEKPLHIYIQGYTPGFNDGEPCVHSVSYAIGFKQIVWEEYTLQEPHMFEDIMDEEALEKLEYDDDGEFDYSVFVDKNDLEVRGLDEILDQLIVPCLDKMYHTDYQVLITLYRGTIKVKHDDYDCGY